MRPLGTLAWALAPLAALADEPVAMDVDAVNEALWTASRCTTRPWGEPTETCRALFEASRERVVLHPMETGQTSSVVTVQRADGSLLRIESSIDESIHGMVWVPSAGLYVGYVDNCGEVGHVVVVHPNGQGLVKMPGPPVLTPAGTHIVSADVDYGGDVVELELFSVQADGLRSVARQQAPVSMAGRVDAVGFVGSTVVVGANLGDDPFVRTFDLSAHLDSPVAAQSIVAPCVESEQARFLTGDQVFLRQAPSTRGVVQAALPWGTCVRARGHFADWELVEVAGQHGFVSRQFLSAAPPVRSPHPQGEAGYCTSLHPVQGYGRYGAEALLQANRRSGLDGYYIAPHVDDFCLSLRPAEGPGIQLGVLERSDSEALDVRFATWTLALAPESAYQAHTSVRLLNDSPLFRPVSASRRPVRPSVPVGMRDEPFHSYFGADRPDVGPAPEQVHMLSVVPDARGLLIHGRQAFDTIGPGGSSFPAGEFSLSEDKREVRFGRSLPAVVLDPCAGAFLPVTLDVTYTPATARFGARVDEATRSRLHACHQGLTPDEYGATRFVVVVDERPDSALLSQLAREPQATRALDSSALSIPWAREWQWGDGDETVTTLRSLTWAECGANNLTELEVHGPERRYRIQTGVYDARDCGL